MKRIAATPAVLLSATFAFGFQRSSQWLKYESAAGRYSVLVPAQPTLTTQDSATASGEKVTQYVALSSEANSVYLTAYFDHIPGATFSMDKARDGMVQAVDGTLLRDTVISLDGNPGREIKILAKGKDGAEFLCWPGFMKWPIGSTSCNSSFPKRKKALLTALGA